MRPAASFTHATTKPKRIPPPPSLGHLSHPRMPCWNLLLSHPCIRPTSPLTPPPTGAMQNLHPNYNPRRKKKKTCCHPSPGQTPQSPPPPFPPPPAPHHATSNDSRRLQEDQSSLQSWHTQSDRRLEVTVPFKAAGNKTRARGTWSRQQRFFRERSALQGACGEGSSGGVQNYERRQTSYHARCLDICHSALATSWLAATAASIKSLRGKRWQENSGDLRCRFCTF